MSGLLEKIRNVEFTGLNRAFNSGKRNNMTYDNDDERGISGGPQRRFTMDDSEKFRLPKLIARGCQIFFLFISMAIAAAILAFQQSNDVGVSGLSGFNMFVTIQGIFVSAFFLAIPLIFERWAKCRGLNRALSQIRVGFIVEGTETALILILALTNTISANVKGCKNPDDDPNADKEGYTDKLPGFCRNKSALSAFLWFSFFAWLVTLILILLRWKDLRKFGNSHTPFIPPEGQEDSEDEPFDARDDDPYYEPYDAPNNNRTSSPPPQINTPPNFPTPNPYAAGQPRQSETFYDNGRPFDDPAPSGYNNQSPFADSAAPPPVNPPLYQQSYEDPYEEISRRLRRDGQ